MAADTKQGCVYALLHPLTLETRYVGITRSAVARRLHDHIRQAKRQSTHKARWICSLLECGLKPVIEILEDSVPSELLAEAEIAWIASLRTSGFRLTNATDGGDGVVGLSPEAIEKIRLSNLGKKRSPEFRQRMRELNLGKTMSPEARRKIGDFFRGRKRSETAVQKAAASNRGKLRSEEARARMRASASKTAIQDQFGNIYESAAEAARCLNLHKTHISRVLRGLQKHTGGYVFSHLNNSEKSHG